MHFQCKKIVFHFSTSKCTRFLFDTISHLSSLSNFLSNNLKNGTEYGWNYFHICMNGRNFPNRCRLAWQHVDWHDRNVWMWKFLFEINFQVDIHKIGINNGDHRANFFCPTFEYYILKLVADVKEIVGKVMSMKCNFIQKA